MKVEYFSEGCLSNIDLELMSSEDKKWLEKSVGRKRRVVSIEEKNTTIIKGRSKNQCWWLSFCHIFCNGEYFKVTIHRSVQKNTEGKSVTLCRVLDGEFSKLLKLSNLSKLCFEEAFIKAAFIEKEWGLNFRWELVDSGFYFGSEKGC